MNGLVLAGGGSKGSWQAGVLEYVAEEGLYPGGFGFISGTSVGAINAVGIGQFKPADFLDGAHYVSDTWHRIKRDTDVYRFRPPHFLAGIGAPSFATATPLGRLLADRVDQDKIKASGIRLRLPAVDLLTGNLVEFNELHDPIVEAVMASASYPCALPPVRIGKGYYTDGGVRDIAPLGAAIRNGCDKILVLVNSDPASAGSVPQKRLETVIGVGARVLDLLCHEILMTDVAQAHKTNERVALGSAPGKRQIDIRIVHPQKPLGPSLSFAASMIRAQIDQGREDAKASLGG